MCPCCRSLSSSQPPHRPRLLPAPPLWATLNIPHTAAPVCRNHLLTLQPQPAVSTYTHCSAILQNSYTHIISFQLPVSSHIEVPACICQSALSNQCVFLTVHCCRPNLLHCVENPISTHPIRQETRHIKIYEPEMFVGLVGHEFLVLFPASHFPL